MGLEEVQERKDEDTEIHKDGGGTEDALGTRGSFISKCISIFKN